MRSKRCAGDRGLLPELASLNTDRFSTQRPEAVNNLLKEAEARNLSLLSARLSRDLAREQIRAAQTGYMPTIDVSASTGISNTKYNGSKTGGANAARQRFRCGPIRSASLQPAAE